MLDLCGYLARSLKALVQSLFMFWKMAVTDVAIRISCDRGSLKMVLQRCPRCQWMPMGKLRPSLLLKLVVPLKKRSLIQNKDQNSQRPQSQHQRTVEISDRYECPSISFSSTQDSRSVRTWKDCRTVVVLMYVCVFFSACLFF